MKIENPTAVIVAFGIFGLLLFLTMWWQVFKYQECKKVRHSTTYCVLNINS